MEKYTAGEMALYSRLKLLYFTTKAYFFFLHNTQTVANSKWCFDVHSILLLLLVFVVEDSSSPTEQLTCTRRLKRRIFSQNAITILYWYSDPMPHAPCPCCPWLNQYRHSHRHSIWSAASCGMASTLTKAGTTGIQTGAPRSFLAAMAATNAICSLITWLQGPSTWQRHAVGGGFSKKRISKLDQVKIPSGKLTPPDACHLDRYSQVKIRTDSASPATFVFSQNS